MTTDSKQCPQCGAPMPSNAPAGLCPRCVMAMNMATETEFTDEVGPHGTRVLKQPPTPDELRDKFPGLEILELLGRGGMGAVYKARQKELDRIVALKILPPGIGEDPAFAERFSREAKALAKLNHPNIVTLYEFGRADGLFFFLMEFVDGVNLRQLLDTGRVASREALAIVPQICDALQYAHDNGIVHRDIKPENILMDRRGRVKVADFGLAKLVGATNETLPSGVIAPQASLLTDAGKIMGTPQYMAPEQKDKPLEVDHRADIYALGVVFYQMLTGELPGKSLEAPSKKVQIDVRLDEIVLRALEKKPELRFQSAEELKTRVETMGTTPPVSPVVPKKNRRTKALACLFVIGAVCAFANMAYALSASYSVDWALVYMWGIGGIGLSLLGVRYTFAARSQKRFPEQGVPPVGSARINTSNETTTPAKSWTERHRGMPKVLWVAICILGISALSNLALLHLNGPVGLVEAVVKSAFILGLWYRVRAVYLLTMFAAFFAGAVAVKLPIPYSLLLVGLTLAVILPLMLCTSWFFPFSMERSRRRLWLGTTTLIALAGFCVMLAAPAPRNLILRGNGGGLDHAPMNQYPTGNVARNEPQTILGSVVERLLQDPDNGDGRSNKETLVLRTGELINALNDAPKQQGGRLRALLASEGDLFAEYDDYVAKRWAITAVKLRLSDFPTTQWDTATPAQIDQSLENPTAVEHVEHFGVTLYLLPDGLVPMTFAFSAKDGSRGLMQITGFDDNPRSIAIRYKLIQTRPANSGNTSIALQNAQRAWKNAGTVFGPVIDRVVRDPRAQGPDSLIDLDTGRLITPPAPRLADWEWMQNSGADAIGDTSDSVRGLIGTGGTVVLPTSSDSWDSITPLELRKTMIPLASSAVESTAMSGLGELPATFLFKTRSQNIGILQITGFTEAPGVNIRYKLLQKANTAVAKSGEYKITLTNGITVEVVAVTRDPLNNGIWWKPDGTKLAKPPGNHVEFTPNNNAEGKDIGKDDHAIFLQYSWNADTSLSKSEDDYGPGGEMLGYLQIQEGGSVNLALEEAKRLGRLISGGAAGPKPSREDIGTAKVLRFPSGTQEATAMFTTAAGPWEKVAVYDGMRTKVSVNGTQVLCTPVPVNPRHEGGPVLMVTHDIDLEKYALRMFAVLTNGKREQTHFYNSKVKSRETQSSVQLGGFERNPANVKEYVLERTPWVHGEIRGIALNPGKRAPARQEAEQAQQTSSANEVSAKSSEAKSYVLPHRVQSGQKVLDTSRDFALEHQWKIQRESGGTTNGLDTVTIEVIDLSGKKVSFTERADPDGAARLIISAEAGSEFSPERIGSALALRLKLADGFVTSAEDLNTLGTTNSSKWKAQIEAMNSMDWRKALATANKVANLPPGEGLAIVRANWTSVTNAESRKQFLKAFTFENHPHLIPVLELGYLDSAPAVQEWGMSYLKGIALRDFSEDYAAGKAWLAQHRHMQLADAMHESIKAAATRVGGSDPKIVEAQLSLIRFSGRFRDQPKAVAGSGMEEVLEQVINGKDLKLTEAALQASGELPLSPSWYQRVVLPKIQPENTLKVRSTAATALHGRGGEWAVQPLLTALTNLLSSTSSTDRLLFSQFAGTLGGIGSPKSIPTMIAVIEAHNDYDTVYGIGYFGLGKLTGVDYDASHDGAWWRQWWEKNKQRFPSDVQALPIPQLSPVKNGSKPHASRTDIDPPVTERFAGGDTNKFYFLIGNTNSAAAPKEGFKLLLVLPGGDGGRAFHPFVKNSFKNALPPGYLMAQLVAPQWDAQQAEQLVWPTEKNRYPAMQFSTEQFVASVIGEIGKQYRLDPRHIYTWSWSSGGPAAYAVSLQPKTKVTGSFVAMSVFKPDELPDITGAKGHTYYILHSPEDFIPMRMAEQARDALKANGAITHLQTYEGGHGWHGDVFGNIRNGIDWLEEQSEKSSKK